MIDVYLAGDIHISDFQVNDYNFSKCQEWLKRENSLHLCSECDLRFKCWTASRPIKSAMYWAYYDKYGIIDMEHINENA